MSDDDDAAEEIGILGQHKNYIQDDSSTEVERSPLLSHGYMHICFCYLCEFHARGKY